MSRRRTIFLSTGVMIDRSNVTIDFEEAGQNIGSARVSGTVLRAIHKVFSVFFEN